MAKNIAELADQLGARVVARLPDTGSGAFGAARLAALVQSLQSQRPVGGSASATVPNLPISETTARKLEHLAEVASASGRKVSATQLAAQLLEEAVAALPDR